MNSMEKLRTQLDTARKELVPFRRNRMNAIRQFVGKHYSDNGAPDKVPVNLLELAVGIYRRNLIARRPRVLCTTRVKELKGSANKARIAINHLLKEIHIHETLKRCAVDGMFGMGILKVASAIEGRVDIDNVVANVGQPYAETVDLDNWVHDMSATHVDRMKFCGDRYRVDKEWALNCGLFEGLNKDKLNAADSSTTKNPEGDERPASVSRGTASVMKDADDDVELMDIWVPRDNLVHTFLAEGNIQAMPIRTTQWTGPESGPYPLLRFGDVPGSIMPPPPVSMMMDLHDLANRLFRKLGRQAESQKNWTGIRAGANRDGKTAVEVADGEVHALDDPRNFANMTSGGIDQKNFAFFLQIRDLFSYFGGNLDALGGLSPSAETLGQDKLLSASASQRMRDMQDEFLVYVQDVVERLSWFLWYDPLIEMPLTMQVPGAEKYGVPFTYSADDKEGDWMDYNFEIVPYSMQYLTPQERLQSLSGLMQNFIIPLAPQLQAEGMTIDYERFVRLYSEYSNLPELEELIIFSANPGSTQQAVGTPPGGHAPAQTKRTYERVNRPGATRSGKDQIMMQALLGGQPQGAEMDTMSRPVG